ncbi:MAG: hypothetical protein ACTHWF_01505 [Brachybacterium sp.]|uniref:hypothetical protein n=1 Tax=unclassified Brachybacterium TaxID=2623841 RepID=UPI00185FC10B|nr:hypothetical protein [Brachybacterium sp. Z12]QNN83044.1 hypothetical protein H3H54_04695 [Brachybacterium sp. Z12]
MTFLRSFSSALGRLADRMQGQDVERPGNVSENRTGGDYAAVIKSRASQGIGPMGMGR